MCIARDMTATRRQMLTNMAALGASVLIPGTSSAQNKPHIIDMHHHIVPPGYLAAVDAMRLRRGQLPQGGEVTNWRPQQSIDEMDKNGVATSVLSISTGGVWFGDVEEARKLSRLCNDFGASMVRDFPGRFGLFAALPLPDTEGSLREIAYAFDTLRADGIGLLTSYDGKYLGDPSFQTVFEELNRRKAIVYVHPAAPVCCQNILPGVSGAYLEYPHDTSRAIVSLLFAGSLARFRDIRFLFSHAGGTLPIITDRMVQIARDRKDLAEKAPNGIVAELRRLHYDTAVSATKTTMAALTNLIPMSQIVFGTDYPFNPISVSGGPLAQFGLSAADLRAIERDNAVRMIPRFAS